MTAEQIQAQIDVINAQLNVVAKQYALQNLNLNSRLTALQAQLAQVQANGSPDA